MKRQTRDELAAECARLVVIKGRERYVYEAYCVTAPHGGILLVTYHYPGQRPSVAAYYLEGFARGKHWLPEQLDHRCAVEQLQAKTHALQLAAYASKGA